MDAWLLVQQLPIEWNAVSASPSTLTARPSFTVTMTPHSFLPQARQQVRTSFTPSPWSPISVSTSSLSSGSPDSARAARGAPAKAAAAPVIAATLANVRRVMLFCMSMFLPFRLCDSECATANPGAWTRCMIAPSAPHLNSCPYGLKYGLVYDLGLVHAHMRRMSLYGLTHVPADLFERDARR